MRAARCPTRRFVVKRVLRWAAAAGRFRGVPLALAAHRAHEAAAPPTTTAGRRVRPGCHRAGRRIGVPAALARCCRGRCRLVAAAAPTGPLPPRHSAGCAADHGPLRRQPTARPRRVARRVAGRPAAHRLPALRRPHRESGSSSTYGNGTPAPRCVYPPASGFVLGPDGGPIKSGRRCCPDTALDRFGFPGGAFLAPLGTPFSARSLPPPSLQHAGRRPLSNYHVYCVSGRSRSTPGRSRPGSPSPAWAPSSSSTRRTCRRPGPA